MIQEEKQKESEEFRKYQMKLLQEIEIDASYAKFTRGDVYKKQLELWLQVSGSM